MYVRHATDIFFGDSKTFTDIIYDMLSLVACDDIFGDGNVLLEVGSSQGVHIYVKQWVH